VRIQVDDINGDEASGKDQTMVPMDFDGKNGHIIDDVIYSEVVGKLPEGCELFCLFDCCHSGTIMDLPYVIAVTPAVEKEIEKVRERERAWAREQARALASDNVRERQRDVSVSVCVCAWHCPSCRVVFQCCPLLPPPTCVLRDMRATKPMLWHGTHNQRQLLALSST